jgi:hypothetical protein
VIIIYTTQSEIEGIPGSTATETVWASTASAARVTGLAVTKTKDEMLAAVTAWASTQKFRPHRR